MDRTGFYERAKRGIGSQFSREDLDAIRVLRTSDVLRRVPGVRLRRNGPGTASAVSRRGQGLSGLCTLEVYVDGMRMFAPYDLDLIPPDQIEGMEIYDGPGTPIQYQSLRTGCGAVLIWTRR